MGGYRRAGHVYPVRGKVAEKLDEWLAFGPPRHGELLGSLFAKLFRMANLRAWSVQLAGLDLLAVLMGHHVMLHPRNEVFLGLFLQGRGDVYFIAD